MGPVLLLFGKKPFVSAMNRSCNSRIIYCYWMLLFSLSSIKANRLFGPSNVNTWQMVPSVVKSDVSADEFNIRHQQDPSSSLPTVPLLGVTNGQSGFSGTTADKRIFLEVPVDAVDDRDSGDQTSAAAAAAAGVSNGDEGPLVVKIEPPYEYRFLRKLGFVEQPNRETWEERRLRKLYSRIFGRRLVWSRLTSKPADSSSSRPTRNIPFLRQQEINDNLLDSGHEDHVDLDDGHDDDAFLVDGGPIMAKRSAKFQPWGGKRGPKFQPWGGKRSMGAFQPWGGKRSTGAFQPWGGKRSMGAFQPWGGKRAAGKFQPWGGKRSDMNVDGGLSGFKAPRFQPWGGKRSALLDSGDLVNNNGGVNFDDGHDNFLAGLSKFQSIRRSDSANDESNNKSEIVPKEDSRKNENMTETEKEKKV